MRRLHFADDVKEFSDFVKEIGITEPKDIEIAKKAWNAAIDSASDAFCQNEGTDYSTGELHVE